MTRKKILYLFAVVSFLFLPLNTVHAATLVGYWPFEETSGSNINDQSGFNNDGQLTGDASRSAGKVGQGLFLDGIGGVSIPHSLSLDSFPDGFTMEAWINPIAYPDYTTIFWKTNRHFRPHMLHFQVNGSLYACMNGPASEDGPCDFEGIAPNTVGLNEWHFVTWTYDNSVQRLWDDGVKVFEAPFTEPWAGNDIDLLIGYHPEINSANFRGVIDEARIYSGALTQDEIIRDMNVGAIPEPSTVFLLTAGLLGLALKRKSAKPPLFPIS